MNNKTRKNYCRDFIKYFLFHEKLYMTFTDFDLHLEWKQWELLGYANILTANRGKGRKDEQRANKAMTQIVRPI